MRAIGSALGVISLGLWACGGATRAPASPVPAASASASPPAIATAPDHTMTRAAVRGAISRGLGAFLQHVEVDDKPVWAGGKFHGFRIAALHDERFWSGVDLRPGDVVTRVNGMPIERPEQAQAVFDSLEGARELRVSYERDGAPRELVYPIVDDH